MCMCEASHSTEDTRHCLNLDIINADTHLLKHIHTLKKGVPVVVVAHLLCIPTAKSRHTLSLDCKEEPYRHSENRTQ